MKFCVAFTRGVRIWRPGMLRCGPLGVGLLGLACARALLLDVRSEGCVSLREDRAVIAVGTQPQ